MNNSFLVAFFKIVSECHISGVKNFQTFIMNAI